MGKIATLLCGILSLASVSLAAERPVVQALCGGDEYQQALCAFYGGELDRAAAGFRNVLMQEPSPTVIRAHYFLARTLMKQQKWSEANRELIRIFGEDPGFYREWGCDFLLGVCRRELGLD